MRVDANKKILDVTCGMRGIWFNKNHPNAIYCDKREETHRSVYGTVPAQRTIEVKPDIQCDFTCLPFDDGTFSLVVFDPPHLEKISEKSWMKKMYGCLDDGWESVIREGFNECMRVLKKDGVLVFKWSEVQISTRKIIDIIGQEPLFGHKSGKKQNTHWMSFMKLEAEHDQQ